MAIDNPLEAEFQQAQFIYDQLTQFFVDYTMQVIGAIIILAFGYFLAKKLSDFVTKFMVNRNVDVTLSQLIGSTAYFGILFCFIVIAIGKFGISITPFVAALGAFTLGAGLAIQGVVGNYGAGFSIILTRPFVVGNTLTVQNFSGVVQQIRLAYTVLSTEDGEEITIPNKDIIGHIIENSFENKLVETHITIRPENDPKLAIRILNESLDQIDCIADSPPRQIGIDSFSEHGIKLGIRCWVPTAKYFDSKYQVNNAIHDGLSENSIHMSIPRQEIEVLSDARG